MNFENHWVMLFLGLLILWFFYQKTVAEGFSDREQSGRRKWKYMYDWIYRGAW